MFYCFGNKSFRKDTPCKGSDCAEEADDAEASVTGGGKAAGALNRQIPEMFGCRSNNSMEVRCMTETSDQAPGSNNGEKPFLVVTTRLNAKQYETAMRHRHAIRLLKLIGLLLGALLLFDIGVMIYYRLPPSEFASIVLRTDDARTWILPAAIVLWFIISAWYYPRRYRKFMTDVYGGQADWTYRYSFFSDALKAETEGEKSSSAASVQYADIRRIQVLSHSIVLKTKARTAYWIARDNLTAEEDLQLLQVLRERCPEAK